MEIRKFDSYPGSNDVAFPFLAIEVNGTKRDPLSGGGYSVARETRDCAIVTLVFGAAGSHGAYPKILCNPTLYKWCAKMAAKSSSTFA
jgi:hypothetical protein